MSSGTLNAPIITGVMRVSQMDTLGATTMTIGGSTCIEIIIRAPISLYDPMNGITFQGNSAQLVLGQDCFLQMDATNTALIFKPASNTCWLMPGGTFAFSGVSGSDVLLSLGGSMNDANIHGSSLYNSIVTGCSVNSVNIQGSSLWNSVLSGSSVTSTDIRGSSLSGCSVNSVHIQGSSLFNSIVSGSSVTSTDVRGSSVSTSTISGCSVNSVDIRGSSLSTCVFSGGTMNASEISGSSMLGSIITGCSVNSVDIRGSSLSNCILAGCSMNASDIRGSSLTNCILSGTTSINEAVFVLQPNNVRFEASLSTNQTSNTNNNWIDINFDTATVNVGGYFNTGTVSFTAPVTGTYLIGINLNITQGLLASGLQLALNNTSSGVTLLCFRDGGLANSARAIGTQQMMSLTGGQVIKAQFLQNGVTTNSTINSNSTRFTGILLG